MKKHHKKQLRIKTPSSFKKLVIVFICLLAIIFPTESQIFASTKPVAQPTPVISIGNSTVSEGTSGNNNIYFSVTLDSPSNTTITVNYSTKSGSAIAGLDFSQTSGTVTFKLNKATGLTPVEESVTVPLIANSSIASTKSFTVVLSNPTAGAIIGQSSGNGTIQDIGPKPSPTVNVGDAGVFNGHTGAARSAQVVVSLSSPATKRVTVNYTLANQTALSPQDYTSVTGSVIIPAGSTSKSFNVSVNPISTPAANKILVMNLSNPINASLGKAQGQVILLSNNNIANPLSSSYNTAVLTSDINPNDNVSDTFGVTGDGKQTTITTGASNISSNSRLVYWPSNQAPLADQESCANWSSEVQNNTSVLSQQGVALRIVTQNGITRAITITKNIYQNEYWFFNVHVWDTSTPGLFTQIGSYDLSTTINGASLPWDICARVIGNNLDFEVWLDGQTQPAWGDITHGASLVLPAGWDYAGYDGWYFGHVAPTNSLDYTNQYTGIPK